MQAILQRLRKKTTAAAPPASSDERHDPGGQVEPVSGCRRRKNLRAVLCGERCQDRLVVFALSMCFFSSRRIGGAEGQLIISQPESELAAAAHADQSLAQRLRAVVRWPATPDDDDQERADDDFANDDIKPLSLQFPRVSFAFDGLAFLAGGLPIWKQRDQTFR